MTTLSKNEVEAFRERGFHVARGVFGQDEIARLREGYDYIVELASRTDLPNEILNGRRNDVHIHLQTPGPMVGPDAVRYLRKVQWPSLIHPAFEEIRNSPRFPALLAPLIGTTLKQYINQINFKMPGGKIQFPWHQDVRPTPAFRDQVNNYVQTIVVVDEATVANGCLHVIPGSHKMGDLRAKRYAKGGVEAQVDVSSAVTCEAMPGDVLMFTSYTVHGSSPNTTNRPRRSYINGFVRASACDVGRWAFLDGKPVPVTSDYDHHEIRYAPNTSSPKNEKTLR
ncbi:MAG: phytanoyl-CoA dioxygenase family protein [Candidatus Latescibacteria bacterium]|nr:phytanoyl-CoA dioxygenase family protein [Candidatus Latescibacterota bacterium]